MSTVLRTQFPGSNRNIRGSPSNFHLNVCSRFSTVSVKRRFLPPGSSNSKTMGILKNGVSASVRCFCTTQTLASFALGSQW